MRKKFYKNLYPKECLDCFKDLDWENWVKIGKMKITKENFLGACYDYVNLGL